MADFLDDLKGKWDSARNNAAKTIDEAIPADNVNKLDELRNKGIKSFSKALVDATDFTPADMRQQKWAKEQKDQRQALVETGADLALPDQYSAIPGLGTVKKVNTAAKEVSNLIKAEKAAVNVAKDINVVESTRKGSKYLEAATDAEKAAEKAKNTFTPVKTPDMGENISHIDIMNELNNSESYKNLIADRNLRRTNPQAYNDRKDYLISKAREFIRLKKAK